MYKQYKIIFAHNEIISCELIANSRIEFGGDYFYEHDNGRLIYAIINAENVVSAVAKAGEIIRKAANNTSGKMFAPVIRNAPDFTGHLPLPSISNS